MTLSGATSLPAGFYTSERFFAAELVHVHRRHWFFVGRVEEWPAPGDYRAIDTPGGPAIVLRDQRGTMRAYANTCRHRGALLLTGRGNCRSIICPYHSWGYRLDGPLAGAPAMEGLSDADRRAYGLLPIRLEEWAGFLFLSYDNDAPDLRSHLGDLPDVFASHRLGEMVCTYTASFPARCNWKLILENAMETYHTGYVHAVTVGAQQSVGVKTHGAWEALQVLSNRSIAVLGDTPPFPPIEGLTEAARRGTYFTCIHPTTQFAVAQDSMWWLAVRPLAADQSVVELGGCFPKPVLSLPDFPERAAPYYDRWRRVFEEDIGILEQQQIGLTSVLHRPGPLSWRDDHVLRLNRWLLAQVPQAAWPV